ncbi:MAG: hypothetical protein ACYCVN_00715 [Acidimicrobiales bacterium]
MTERSPHQRRAQRVLSMVGELHKWGYQRLRAIPAMAPSGMYWRCMITPASNTLRTHGGHLANWDFDGRLVATYSSGGEGNEYFGWTDRKDADARVLADTFVERFPEICGASRGADWLYAGWFVEVLGIAEQGWFPYLYADYDIDESHGLALSSPDERLEAAGNKPTLPPPPPGEADDPGWEPKGE